MGAFAYCRVCDTPMDKPTAREVIEGEQHCLNGHWNEPKMTRDDLLIELAERVEELETKMATLVITNG